MAPAAWLDQSSKSKAVCVMDASSPLGCGLVRRLLRAGFTVNAAIFKNGDLTFEEYEKNKKVKILHSDPFDYHSILEALKGCCALFYTFDPSSAGAGDESKVEEEVRAAQNVMEACAQTETVEKVVFSSSVTAVIWRDDRNSVAVSHLGETFWSDPHFCRSFKLWHGLSKTLSEKAAWALAMDRGVDMVSINAGLLMSPDLTIEHPYLKGAAEMYEDGLFVTVDLDYLVEAHIRVFQDVSSYGRYICFNRVINRHEDAVDFARKLTPSAPQSEERCLVKIPQRISNKKLNKLMMDFKGEDQLD